MIEVTIKKPLFGTKVYIREKFLRQAAKEHTVVRVTCQGIAYLVEPKEWVKTGDMMKKVFLIPEKPMVLWGNFLERFQKDEAKQLSVT